MPFDHHLTKYNYLQFLVCPETLWLLKNGMIPEVPPTEEALHNIEQGKLIDRLAQQLFQQPDFLSGRNIRPENVIFQRSIRQDGLSTRCDILVELENGEYDLYEVKSSTGLKDEYIHDIAFQVVAFEKAGYPIRDTYLVHVNKDYTRMGAIQVEALLVITPTSDPVFSALPVTREWVQSALEYIQGPEPDPGTFHYCDQKQDCPFFRQQYPDFPEVSVFDVARISSPKIQQLLEAGIYRMEDIPVDFPLSDRQRNQVEAYKIREPVIQSREIRAFLQQLRYPLYFLDYESFAYAVPVQDRIRPYQQLVYQYSLHIQSEPGGELRHAEYLLNAKDEPLENLVEHLRRSIATDDGHVIVWNKSFEMTRNKELAALFPAHEDFFTSLNHRLFDLMDIFSKQWYLHPAFNGKYSIKKVLPVLVPDLSYTQLSIDNGTLSNIRWHQLTEGLIAPDDREQVWNDLLAYCKMDTMAMVEVLGVLEGV